MSHSGIPILANLAASVADNITDRGNDTMVQPNGDARHPPPPPRPSAPPATPTPSDPSVTKAETDEDQKLAQGQAANILTGGAGLLTQPYTSRATLLGS